MRKSLLKAANASRTVLVFGIGLTTLVFVGTAMSREGENVAGPPAAEHHGHIRSPAGAELLMEMERRQSGQQSVNAVASTSAADLLEALDRARVERSLVLSIAYMFGRPDFDVDDEYAKVRAENDYVAEQVATAPDRLVGACSVNPLADYAFDEIERCGEDSRLGALKLHLANSDVDLRDDVHVQRLVSVFQKLGRLELPAVVHLRTGNPNYGAEDARIFIEEVLSQAPGLPVQIAHMAGWGGYDVATDEALGVFAEAIAARRLNRDLITFDLAAVVFQPAAAGSDTALERQVREANRKLAARIREIGTTRVIFATDWPSWPPTRNPTMKIEQNAHLIEQELPLSSTELTRVFANTNVILRGVPRR